MSEGDLSHLCLSESSKRLVESGPTKQRQGQITYVGEEPISFSWRSQFFRQSFIQEGEELGEEQLWWWW